MRKVRTAGALGIPALAAAGVLGVGPAAPAGAQTTTPILGDFDGDGRTDRARLGEAGADCVVTVEPGLPGGGFGAPVQHVYPAPGIDGYCPDVGAGVDLGGDGRWELLLAWFSGPEGYPHDIAVMRNYQVVAGVDALSQPSEILTRDLNGDGLVDVYEDGGNDEGFASLLNTPQGTLVPGPLRHGFPIAQDILADVDEDGRLDLVVEFMGGGPTGADDGLEVILDDGTVVPIHSQSDRRIVAVSDVNGDANLDIREQDTLTGKTFTWLGDGRGHFRPK